MRIRSTKPEFWRSETIARQDWDARLVLKGLESYVDDNGVGKDSVVLICADVFPHDLANDRETVARVSRAVASLASANLIVRYAIDGESLIYIRRWKDFQRVDRPNKGRYPRPDGTLEYSDDVDESVVAGQDTVRQPFDHGIREGVASPREGVARVTGDRNAGTGEQGNRGTGEQDDDWPSEPPFDPDAEPQDVVVDPAQVPAVIGANASRPERRRPSGAALTVVRQVLGSAGYPRPTVERLAVQVQSLARDGHPDELIRRALTAWDQKPNCDRPEYLPTVLGDLVKASRAVNGVTPGEAKVLGWAELGQRDNHDQREAIGQ